MDSAFTERHAANGALPLFRGGGIMGIKTP